MKTIAGIAVFVGIMLLGNYAFDIRPSLAELILVVLACTVSNAVSDR